MLNHQLAQAKIPPNMVEMPVGRITIPLGQSNFYSMDVTKYASVPMEAEP